MQPAGMEQVEAARADGRWENAYAPASEMVVPDDFLKALEKKKLATKPRPEALKKPPSESNKRKPVFWNNKEWWCCDPSTGGKCNGKWRCHHPRTCQGKAFVAKRETEEKRSPSNKKQKLKTAMEAIVQEKQYDSDGNSI